MDKGSLVIQNGGELLWAHFEKANRFEFFDSRGCVEALDMLNLCTLVPLHVCADHVKNKTAGRIIAFFSTRFLG